jgi:hypothetical protein
MIYRKLAASCAAALAIAAPAMAATAPANDGARLAAQYSAWAGGRANAEALVSGMRNGSAITLVTGGADRNMSLAGFTPPGAMGYGNIEAALAGAQRSLARAGITRPTAEQIQAALIGGEIDAAKGQVLRGTIGARATPQVATR